MSKPTPEHRALVDERVALEQMRCRRDLDADEYIALTSAVARIDRMLKRLAEANTRGWET